MAVRSSNIVAARGSPAPDVHPLALLSLTLAKPWPMPSGRRSARAAWTR